MDSIISYIPPTAEEMLMPRPSGGGGGGFSEPLMRDGKLVGYAVHELSGTTIELLDGRIIHIKSTYKAE